jgi:hypothetical protein
LKSLYLQRVMKIKQDCGFVKTKPIKANNQSSLIHNQLKSKPNLLKYCCLQLRTSEKSLLFRSSKKAWKGFEKSVIIRITQTIQDGFRYGKNGEHGGLSNLGCRFGNFFYVGQI